MSTQQSSQADELDLTDIFTLIKRGFRNFLKECFKAVAFIVKFWWLLLILIALGVVLGFIKQPAKKFEGLSTSQINYDAQPYVYNAIDQVNTMLKNPDKGFLEALKVSSKEEIYVKSISLKPIINFVELNDQLKGNDRTVDILIKQVGVLGEDVGLLESSVFSSTYQFHKLGYVVSNPAYNSQVQSIVDYINAIPEIEEYGIEVAKNRIERLDLMEKTIQEMSALADGYIKALNAETISGNAVIALSNGDIDLSEFFLIKDQATASYERAKNTSIRFNETYL